MFPRLKKVEPFDLRPPYYIHFGQYTHPMGSGRPPWAAGELLYFVLICIIYYNISFYTVLNRILLLNAGQMVPTLTVIE